MKRYAFIFVALCGLVTIVSFSKQEKIVLCLFYTPSHQGLADDYFFKTLQDDFEIVHYTASQALCPTGVFYKEGWQRMTAEKIKCILQAIKDHPGRVLLYSDVDIQWFRPATDDLLSLIDGYDLRIQRDRMQPDKFGNPIACTGFVIQYCNEKTEAAWQAAYDFMIGKEEIQDDQKAFNKVLNESIISGLVWDYLPLRYFGGGMLIYHKAGHDRENAISKDIVMHHGNYVIGEKNKRRQLDYVASVVEKRRFNK